MQLILDIGSGRSLPDADTAIKLINEVIKRDTGKHEIIFKTQLFESAPPNKPLSHEVFAEVWNYAKVKGYHATSSVFDQESLAYLLEWDASSWPLPFIKIACRPDLYWLIGEIPRRIPVYCSGRYDMSLPKYLLAAQGYCDEQWDVWLTCVPEYPAQELDYKKGCHLWISDHTVGWDLYKKYEPDILEKHVCLAHNDTNPDAGAFAVTVDELSEIL